MFCKCFTNWSQLFCEIIIGSIFILFGIIFSWYNVSRVFSIGLLNSDRTRTVFSEVCGWYDCMSRNAKTSWGNRMLSSIKCNRLKFTNKSWRCMCSAPPQVLKNGFIICIFKTNTRLQLRCGCVAHVLPVIYLSNQACTSAEKPHYGQSEQASEGFFQRKITDFHTSKAASPQ